MSEDTKQLFEERVRKLVSIVGSIERLAVLSGISGRMILKYMSGQADPSRERLIAMAQAANVNVLWLATGEGPVAQSPHGPFIENLTIRSASYVSAIGAAMGGFVYIPMMQGKISAGGGLVPDNMIDIAVAFRKDWILRKGDPRNMAVIRIQGDSMEPTLRSGDIMLVNQNIQSVAVNGGIYAIAFKDEILIKRVVVSFPDGCLRIVSDNKEYPEFAVAPEDISINGKAIWYGRDLDR